MKTIYNEENYLNHPDVMATFQKMYENYAIRKKEEENVYSSPLSKYDTFIEEVATLLRQLGYHSVLDCSILLSYLISSGTLSCDYAFQEEAPNPKEEIEHRPGTSILKGVGCCRNYADMHYDVFKRLGLSSEKLYCHEGIFLMKSAFNKPANHVINLVPYEDNLYGIDLYNHNRLFHFHSPLVLKEVSTKSSIRLLYKPYYEATVNDISYSELLKKLNEYYECSKKTILNPFIYEDQIKYPTIQRVRKEEDTLNQFHQKTKSLKREIVKEIESKKRKN